MRFLLVIVLSLASTPFCSATAWAGRSSVQICCTVYPYTFPSTTYTVTGDPRFVNSNLYFYRSYYPYPPVTLLHPRPPRR
jgi:hypothetical protein